MAKTYKHQRNYDYHKWWRDHNPFGEWGYSVRGNILLRFWLPAEPEQVCPYPSWYYYSDDCRKSKYYRESYKKMRHKWTRLLASLDFDRMDRTSLKPENQDYNIW